MHKHVFIAAASAFILASTAAFAWSNVSGKIQRVDPDNHQLTLDDGKTYTAQDGINLADLKAGESVTISTKVENGQNVVNKVTKNS